MNYNDIMLDIETFGTGTDAAIVQIGAVGFDTTPAGANDDLFAPFNADALLHSNQGFRINVDLAKSRHPGSFDADTVMWWLGQSIESRESITGGVRHELGAALHAFSNWVKRVAGRPRALSLWSNGPTFDETIVRSAFARYSMEFPISFRGSRCCRTLAAAADSMGWSMRLFRDTRENAMLAHDGLADAVFQARGVVQQLAFIRGRAAVPARD